MPGESKDVRRSLEQELISRGVRMTHQRRLLIHLVRRTYEFVYDDGLGSPVI
jgi:Fe2+ or Zn2+ uptake regulation protein